MVKVLDPETGGNIAEVLPDKEKIYGCCKYCGQIKLIHPLRPIDEKTADVLATQSCDCADAKKARVGIIKIENSRKYVKTQVDKISQINFLPEEQQIHLEALMNAAVRAAWSGAAGSCSINVGTYGVGISVKKQMIRIKVVNRQEHTQEI